MSKESRKVVDLAIGRASGRYLHITPTKARRVVDLVRGRNAEEAVTILNFAPQAASSQARKVLESAMRSILDKRQRNGLAVSRPALYVAEAFVDEGPTMKRYRPRAKGRAGRILKRTSHITFVVRQSETAGAEAKKGRNR
ncbi:MAG: 50S ribosomal protein L22 [Bifidobacteriaceae bacterium]|jgi:large subunit ribosomal protein L22|nr:50S ribosomal protein L22 [Bifidobacteriaceae bacterium]